MDRCLRCTTREPGEASRALASDGLWMEAAALNEVGALVQAEKLVERGLVLTPCDDAYPRRWLTILGSSAPPALWRHGPVPPGPYITIVGSRHISGLTRKFAKQTVLFAAEKGYAIASGAAAGVDRAAASASPPDRLLQILPYGLEQGCGLRGCLLSLARPSELFSAPLAMERNALLYALSERTLVVEARFRVGGSWVGATAALRRRLTQVLVRSDGSQASRALVALGAHAVSHPDEVFREVTTSQPILGW